MRYHALQASKRNVNALSSEGTSITSILQAAAGRAWSRSARSKSTHAATRIRSKASEPNYDGKQQQQQQQQSSGAGTPAESSIGFGAFMRYVRPSSGFKIRRRPVGERRVYVNPTRLTAHEFVFVDPAAAYILPSDVDHIHPSEVLLPESLIHDRKRPLPPPIKFDNPETTSELCANLFRWKNSRPTHVQTTIITPSFSALHAYHSRHPGLQSKKSFRMLAEAAIDESNFGGVRMLLKEMEQKGLANEWHNPMWAIWVRWMVRRGRWADAWQTVTHTITRAAAAPRESDMPLPIWLEFWGSAKMRALRRTRRDEHGRRRLHLANLPHELYSDMGRYYVLMRHAPRLDELQVKTVPPRLVYAIVRARLWGGKRDWAMDITRNYLRTAASEEATDRELKMCLRLIHLHLSIGWNKMGFQTLKTMRRITDELLKLNPRIRPDSRTLVLLLRSLRGTRMSGSNALRLIKEFKIRYGDLVEDRQVRLRAASLAAKEGNQKVLGRLMTLTNVRIAQREVGRTWGRSEFLHWRRLAGIRRKL